VSWYHKNRKRRALSNIHINILGSAMTGAISPVRAKVSTTKGFDVEGRDANSLRIAYTPIVRDMRRHSLKVPRPRNSATKNFNDSAVRKIPIYMNTTEPICCPMVRRLGI
jgi:hypothetical protein